MRIGVLNVSLALLTTACLLPMQSPASNADQIATYHFQLKGGCDFSLQTALNGTTKRGKGSMASNGVIRFENYFKNEARDLALGFTCIPKPVE